MRRASMCHPQRHRRNTLPPLSRRRRLPWHLTRRSCPVPHLPPRLALVRRRLRLRCRPSSDNRAMRSGRCLRRRRRMLSVWKRSCAKPPGARSSPRSAASVPNAMPRASRCCAAARPPPPRRRPRKQPSPRRLPSKRPPTSPRPSRRSQTRGRRLVHQRWQRLPHPSRRS